MPKYLCTEGHLHNEQWRADNCATCKRNNRRRLLRFVKTPAFQKMVTRLHRAAFPAKKNGKPLPNSKDRAIRRRLVKGGDTLMPWIKLPDGTRAHVKLARNARVPAACRAPDASGQRCGVISGYLCDFPINDEGDTCDMPICEAHANVVGEDRHHCPKHYKPQEAA